MDRIRDENGNGMPKGMGWRIAVTILTFFASIIGIILWLFFYAGNFNVYQNIAVIVAILIGFVAVMGATWASWGMKQKSYWTGKGGPRSC
jgi:hypothetical protein